MRPCKKTVSTGAVAGGLIGGLAGALGSGTAGYYSERQKLISDDSQRIASYGGDFERSAEDHCGQQCVGFLQPADSFGKTAAAFAVADALGPVCGLQVAEFALIAVLSGCGVDDAAIQIGRTGEDINTYTQAYEKDLQEVGVQRQAVIAVADKPAAKPKAVPQEALATEKKLQQATTKRSEAKAVSSRSTSIVSSACNNPDIGDWGGDAYGSSA